ARAGLVLLTRSHFNDLAPAIERQIRCWNPKAPIFRGRVRPRAWVENRTGVRHPLESRPFSRPTAFCGLGNPQSFRRTLDQMGVTLADWIEFGDHHRYHPHQLRRIALHSRAAGADALITTEKDSINLCEPCAEIAAPLEIYWLEAALEIENESEFLGYIEARLRRDAL
ncbi:MAG TPA: tetraacyldisaccharide 4'-kinase, partial [Bryobacteraceae bacterium]|nr:tetraacyldisaccharide 4'-kinase [Bryobacteraceae bacterium]